MILAFPTETLEDFEESMELVRKYKFPSLFINQYYPRSGTPAARLKKIDTIEARKRTAAMSELFRSYTRFTEDRIGEIHNVLVTEVAAGEDYFKIRYSRFSWLLNSSLICDSFHLSINSVQIEMKHVIYMVIECSLLQYPIIIQIIMINGRHSANNVNAIFKFYEKRNGILYEIDHCSLIS